MGPSRNPKTWDEKRVSLTTVHIYESVAAPAFTEGRGQSKQGVPKGAWYVRFRNRLLLIIHTSEC